MYAPVRDCWHFTYDLHIQLPLMHVSYKWILWWVIFLIFKNTQQERLLERSIKRVWDEMRLCINIILVGKSKGNRPLMGHGCRWETNIKLYKVNKQNDENVKFEFLTTVTLKSNNFWDETPCSMMDCYYPFWREGRHSLHSNPYSYWFAKGQCRVLSLPISVPFLSRLALLV
jgi:hypothetical protein